MAAPSSPSSPMIKFSFNSYYYYYYHCYYPNRRRFLAASFPTSSSPSPFACCCRSSSTDNDKTSLCTNTQLKRSDHRKVKVATQFDAFSNNDEEDSEFFRNGVDLQRLNFEKKALWRRSFFPSKKVRSILLLNFITIIYASNIPIVKEVEAIIDPGAFTVVRFVLAATAFLPFLLKARDDVQTRNAGIELGFWVSLGYLMQALGLQTAGAGRASFLTMFTVIVVPLLAGMLGSRIPARTWFGALMSIVGVGMLESSGAPPCVGDLLNFLSVVFFGVHMLRTEHISRITTKDNFLPLLGYEVSVVAFLSTLWYIIGALSGGNQLLNPSSWTWAKFSDWMVVFPWIPAIYTGIVSTGLCLWAEMTAMRDVSATETAIIYGLEPLWGAGFAWLLLGERWGVIGWIGAALVLGGSLTVQIQEASSSTALQRDEITSERTDDLLIPDDEKVFSTSAVLVNTTNKDSRKSLKKRGL